MFSTLPNRDAQGGHSCLMRAHLGTEPGDGGEVARAEGGRAAGGAQVAAAAYPCDRDPSSQYRCSGTDVRYVCRNGRRGWFCDICGARLSNEAQHGC